MYYIRFINDENIYQMKIKTFGTNLVQIYPPLPDVDLTAGFELLTKAEGGKVYGNYRDYTTVYRQMDDGSIIMSNDRSVYVPPAEPEPIEPYVPTLEEVKAVKLREVSEVCEQTIYAGVTVVLPNGPEHFSLTEKDQLNLFGKQAQLAAGAELLEYHQDGHPCRYYTAAEMRAIITAAMHHVSYHTTYCNSLNMWIAGCESREEVESIFYGADIPEQYQSEILKDYLRITDEAESMINAEKETIS